MEGDADGQAAGEEEGGGAGGRLTPRVFEGEPAAVRFFEGGEEGEGGGGGWARSSRRAERAASLSLPLRPACGTQFSI